MPLKTNLRKEYEARRGDRQGRMNELMGLLQPQEPSDPFEPTPIPEPEPGLIEKYSPAAVRGIGALLGLTPARGIGASAGAEAIAQGIEKYTGAREEFSPSAIAAAGVTGGLGGWAGQAIGAGRVGVAAARGAIAGGGSPIVEHAFEHGDMAPIEDVAMGTAVGGGVSAGLAKLLNVAGVKPWAKKDTGPKPASFEVTDNSGKTVKTIGGSGESAGPLPTPGGGPSPAPNVPYREGQPENFPGPRQQKIIASEAKLQREKDKLQRIKDLVEGRGLKAGKASARESLSATDPETGISSSVGVQYSAPRGKKGARAVGPLDDAPPSAPAPTTPPPTSPEPNYTIIDDVPPETPVGPQSNAAKGASALEEAMKTDFVSQNLANNPNMMEELVAKASGMPPRPERMTGGMWDRRRWSGVPSIGRRAGDALEERVLDSRISGLPPETGPEPPPDLFGVPVRPPKGPGPLPPAGGEEFPIDDIAQRILNERAAARNTVSQPIEAAASAAGHEGPATLYPSRVAAAGSHYDRLKSLLAMGEPNLNNPAVQREAINKTAGRALQREARDAGLPTGGPKMSRKTVPASAQVTDAEMQALGWAPETPPAAPAAAAPTERRTNPLEALLGGRRAGDTPVRTNPETGLLERDKPLASDFKEMMRRVQSLGRKPGGAGRYGSETGAIDPQLLTRLGMGVGGAAVGGALDDDNPLRGAAIGGGLGLAAPNIIQGVAKLAQKAAVIPTRDPQTAQTVQALSNPAAISQSSQDLLATLPQVYRANLLTSPNLVNNALVAPFSSVIMKGLELHIAGDPRGAMILREANPANFGKLWWESLEEAQRLIRESGDLERAGSFSLDSPASSVIAGPGIMMSAGDVAARRILSSAGLSEAETRVATLTSEPEFQFTRSLVNAQRSGGPLMQFLFPFARTLGNTMEQSALRTPVVGSVLQRFREVPDPMNVQLAQQGLGAATLGGSAAAGYYGPDAQDHPYWSRFVRSLTSTAAGPMSALGAAGYTAGQVLQAGDGAEQAIGRGIESGISQTPLPTLETPLDYVRFVRGNSQGRHIPPSGILPGGGYTSSALEDMLYGNKTRGKSGKRETRK